MSRRGERPEKRQRELARRARASAKAARRQEPAVDDGPAPVDSAALLESFRILSEAHAAGEVTDATFAALREEILTDLGVDPD
jgi:hypothetical protein